MYACVPDLTMVPGTVRWYQYPAKSHFQSTDPSPSTVQDRVRLRRSRRRLTLYE